MYVPMGTGNDRPMETEILSGQDIQLNSDLLEMLKNAYILGTGVPAAIVNYLNEADFAKQIEQNNTKFNGRVVNYQLDFNKSITAFYKKILRWSTNLSDTVIDNFEFQLQPPKQTVTNTKAETVEGFDRIFTFIANLLFENPENLEAGSEDAKLLKEFKRLVVADQMPMLDIDHMKELLDEAKINVKQEKFTPNPANGEGTDDIGFDDALSNLTL